VAKKKAKKAKKKTRPRFAGVREDVARREHATTYVMCPVHGRRFPKGGQCPEC
jgi:hypothetical protein